MADELWLCGRKGQPFEPDARMKALMNEGVAMGNATARALCFAPRDESARKYGAWLYAFHETSRDVYI